MRKALAVFVSIIALCVMASAIAPTGIMPGVAVAEAAKPKKPKLKPNVAVPCNVRPGVVANIPLSVGKSYRLSDVHLNLSRCLFNAVPRGGSIFVAMYSINSKEDAAALTKAHQRGVNVRITVWNERHNTVTKGIARMLGSNPRARSYLIPCVGSCLRSNVILSPKDRLNPKKVQKARDSNGTQHAKGIAIPYLIGPGRRIIRNVSMIGSANLTYDTARTSWNSNNVVVGNACVYGYLARYIYAQRLDRWQGSWPARRCGNYSVYFSPNSDSLKQDAILKTLKATSCRAKPGYGYRGRTYIRISQFLITAPRKDIAKAVVKKHRQGCNIAFITTAHTRPKRPIMGTYMAGRGVPVFDGANDMNGDRKVDVAMHDKMMLVSGTVSGRGQTLTFMGGRNWTKGGVKVNTELMILDRQRSTLLTMNRYWGLAASKSLRFPKSKKRSNNYLLPLAPPKQRVLAAIR